MTSSIPAPTFDDPNHIIETGSVDATPALDPATFDLDAWIGGATATVRAVTLYARADLIAEIDELSRQLRIAESIPDDDRSMGDPSPEGIRQQLEQLAQAFEASALVFKVEGRSDEAREKIAKRLKKQGVDEYDIVLHQLADAIVEPRGVTPAQLRLIGQRSESQLKMLVTASSMASFQPPRVDVPFSSASSGSRKRDRSS